MARKLLQSLMVLSFLLATLLPASGSPLELRSVTFPERKTVSVPIVARPAAPKATLRAEVTHRKGQARIELFYESMKPAILFGGDVTCYVVWAVTRDGTAENLGELLTSKPSGKLTFYTGQKNFALMVTAEAYYLVGRPSELVVFRNVGPLGQPELASPFTFDKFAPAPRHSMDGIAHLKWDSRVPLELLQARKAYELATNADAASYAGQVYSEAGEAVKSANEIARTTTRGRELLDAARRAVALSNEALNISMHHIEAMRIEQDLARRREETAALERRAAEAEAAVAEAQRLTEQARQEAGQARAERERMVAETTVLRTERATLESAMVLLRQDKAELQTESARLQGEKTTLEEESLRLRQEKTLLEQESRRLEQEKAELMQRSARLQQEKADLQRESEKLRREKDELTSRLQSALSHVAETTDSARGYVISLPDILFEVDQATLKTDAQLVLAKLAGILLILPDQQVIIEGHTDSTGGTDYNLDLSQRRASAVMSLLASQGLNHARLRAMGFGMQRPVADNATADGRRRNRRVEIVISHGSRTVASN